MMVKRRILLVVLVAVFCAAVPGTTQEVLLWKHSGPAVLGDPEKLSSTENVGSSWVGPEYALQKALLDNGYICTVVEELPVWLDRYQIIFITLGFAFLEGGCTGQGARHTPAGVIDAAARQRLIEHLRKGGSLYLEGNDFARDHLDGGFLPLLGCSFVNDGGNWFQGKITELIGQNHTITQKIRFKYSDMLEPNESVDVIEANGGELIFVSEDGKGRAVAYHNKPEGYKVISTSFVFGALIDEENLNTKRELMSRYLHYLMTSGN